MRLLAKIGKKQLDEQELVLIEAAKHPALGADETEVDSGLFEAMTQEGGKGVIIP